MIRGSVHGIRVSRTTFLNWFFSHNLSLVGKSYGLWNTALRLVQLVTYRHNRGEPIMRFILVLAVLIVASAQLAFASAPEGEVVSGVVVVENNSPKLNLDGNLYELDGKRAEELLKRNGEEVEVRGVARQDGERRQLTITQLEQEIAADSK